MDKYDLFCLIFLALDADWEETHDEELGKYLSDANPFLFTEKTSAIQDVYKDYCHFLGNSVVTTENSFELATAYISQLNNPAVTKSFSDIDKEQWNEAAEQFLQKQ